MGKQMGDIKKEGRGRSHKVIYELPMLKYTSFPTIATLSWHDITDGQDRRRNPHHTTAFQSLNVSKKKNSVFEDLFTLFDIFVKQQGQISNHKRQNHTGEKLGGAFEFLFRQNSELDGKCGISRSDGLGKNSFSVFIEELDVLEHFP